MLQTTRNNLIPLIIVTLLLLIAAGVRFHDLGVQSFWYDEGVAYSHSQRNLFELIPALRNNVHVPAYFGTLALWEDFVGSTEFGLRSYSVLWSVVSVAAAYALAKRLSSPIAGVAAAAFVALNTFSIYYAQEARMYAMLAAIGALSMWAFVGFWQKSLRPFVSQSIPALQKSAEFRWIVALCILNTIGAYTHFSYALVMVAQGVMAVLALGNLIYRAATARIPFQVLRRAFLLYFVANLITVLLFLPWMFTAISQVSAQPNISAEISYADMSRILQGWMAYGITYEASLGSMAFVIYFFLIFGLIVLDDSRSRVWWHILLPVVWVLLSIGLYLYFGLYTRYLRFLLPTQIAVAVWMGRGVWMLWRVIPRAANMQDPSRRAIIRRNMPKIAATVAVIAFSYTLAQGIPPLYNDEKYQRDDYRQLAAVIEQEGQQGDTIILSAPGLQEIFNYYYDGDLPVYPLPAGADIASDTRAVIAEHERIFVVLYGAAEQDPQGLVTSTLNAEAYQLNAEWIDNIRLERYVSPVTFDEVETVNAQFGENITLESYALSATTVSPNAALQIQLHWMTDAPLETRYKVFVQLLNSDGVLVAQRDSEPSGGQALTTLWQPNETVTDNHALLIPSDLAAGEYTLIIGLYDANNPNDRLAVEDRDYLELETIQVD
jgi:mannosyltransferase